MSDIEVAVSVTDTPAAATAASSVPMAAADGPAPTPKASAWQKMRRGIISDTKTGMIIFLVGCNVITGYNYMYAAMADHRDYFAYNGSFGPVAYLPADKLAAPGYGPAQSVFHAGEKVSFVTNLCVNAGVSITGRAELVRTAQAGIPEAIIDRRVTDVPPSMHRCGPRIGSFEFPEDALPGTYEIRRTVDVDGETSTLRQWWPLRLALEPLDMQLVTTPPAK